MAKKPVKKPHPKYIPELHPKLARQYCIMHKATDEKLSEFLEISLSTLYRWKEEYPEFRQSVKEGKRFTDDEVAISGLLKRALGYEYEEKEIKIVPQHMLVKNADGTTTKKTIEHITKKVILRKMPPDVRAQEFWLRNRQKELWRAKDSIELSGPDGMPLNTNREGKVTVYVPNNKRDPKLNKVKK